MDHDFTSSHGGFVAENAQAGVEQYRLDLDPTKSIADSIEALIQKARNAIADQQSSAFQASLSAATGSAPHVQPAASISPANRLG